MKFLPKFCCLFIPIHRAYILITYLDLIRFSFASVFLCVIFFSLEFTTAEYIFQTLVYLMNCWQSFYCLKALNVLFSKNSLKIHKIYFLSKIAFWLINALKFVLNTKKDCYLFKSDANCFIEGYTTIMYADFGLIILDIYLFIIVYSFMGNLQKGKYGILEGNPIFPEALHLFNEGIFKEATIIESYGFKIKTLKQGTKPQEGKVLQGTVQKMRKRNFNYLKIFPFPLILSNKSTKNMIKKNHEGITIFDLENAQHV